MRNLHELHSLRSLHRLRGLHGLHGLRELRSLHGLHRLRGLRGRHGLHGLRGLPGLPGLPRVHELPGLRGLHALPWVHDLHGLHALRDLHERHELPGLKLVVRQQNKNGGSKIAIKVIELAEKNELHCRYDRQTSAQACYIELDCRRKTLTASYNAEIGNAVPFTVYHGHDQRFGIPALTTAAANALLDEVAPLAERVIAGYSSEWDGRNHVAEFDDDATAALEEITAICDAVEADETNSVQAWDAGDYLQPSLTSRDENGKSCKWGRAVRFDIDGAGTITSQTTDAEISDIKEKIESDLDENTELDGLMRWLLDLRDDCKHNVD